MSRIGKQEIAVPSGVEVKVNASNRSIDVKGPKGNLSFDWREEVDVQFDKKEKTGKLLMSVLESKVEKLLKTGFLALALEIVEIKSEMSWKSNPIHKRLSENS